ncbi:MAG: hypothetical protein H7Z41_04715 [Cytophagales bacterium]|nr:hypothetical protein [Armatimonadota bacterium]
MPLNDDHIRLNHFSDHFKEPYFRTAMEQHVRAYHAHFGERLLAVYVWGSVHRNEAVRGLSDLDLHAFIADAFHEADEAWYGQARAAMDREFPGLASLTRPLPAKLLGEGAAGATPDSSGPARAIARSLSFRLRYDATRIWGSELGTETIIPVPDREFARGAFEAVRDLARFAAGRDRQNKTDFELPVEPVPRLRKLARLAVLGAGYWLMANGRFASFKGTEVLPLLKNELPEWRLFLETTERLYILPPRASSEEIEDYQAHLLSWLDWVDLSFRKENHV